MTEGLQKRRTPYLLMSPAWLVLGLLLVAPLVIMLVISFGQKGPHGALQPVTDWIAYVFGGEFLANYRRSLEPNDLAIYWRSLWMAVVTTVLCLLISYPVGHYIAVSARQLE